LATLCFGQTDTIYSNNQKISCSVKEIAPDVVKYTLADNDYATSMYKNSIQKIVFKDGQVRDLTESTPFKKVESVNDYNNVTITNASDDVKGLFKIGELDTKSKGTTSYSSQDKVRDKAFNKFKIEAAMIGANVIYLTYQNTQPYQPMVDNYPGSTTETNLSTIAYTSSLPSFDDFKALVSDKKEFAATLETSMKKNANDMTQTDIQKKFIVNSISNDNGSIIVNGSLEGDSQCSTFRVVSFTKDSFNIYYIEKNAEYNLRINL